MVEFRCFKCRKPVEIPQSQCKKVPFRKGIMAWKATHSCGTDVYKIVGKGG